MVALAAIASAQEKPNPAQTTSNSTRPTPYQGLAIDRPRVLDPRDLEAQIAALQRKLRMLNFVDNVSLAAALGRIQGAEAEASAIGVSANLMLPYTLITDVTQSVTNAQGTSSTTTNTTTNQQDKPTVTNPTATASAPALPTLQQSARDLQREMLQMEISNLVSTLNMVRTLGDRTLYDGKGVPNSRARVVLTIPLSVEAKQKNAVADFEVKLKFAPSNDSANSTPIGGVQVVGLFPSSTSYNKSVFSEKSSGFNGSALAQPLGIGFASSSDKKTGYLVQDQDLVAYQLGSDSDTDITVKYEIRPVLGRQSVEAGTRNVMIELSLPYADSGLSYTTDVKSYWTFYDRGRARTTDMISGTKCSTQKFAATPVLASSGVAKFLSPTVTTVDWKDVGSDKLLVDIRGDKFLEGTTVVVGGTQYVSTGLDPAQNENHLSFVSPARDVLNFGARVVGKYGDSVEVVDYAPAIWDTVAMQHSSLSIEGFEPTGEADMLATVTLAPPASVVTAFIPASSSAALNLQQTGMTPEDVRLLIRSSSQIYGTTTHPIRTTVNQEQSNAGSIRLEMRFLASRAEALNERFELFRPFRAKAKDLGKAAIASNLPFTIDSVSVVSKDKENVKILAKGSLLSKNIKLVLDKDHPVSQAFKGSLIYSVPLAQVTTASALLFKDDKENFVAVAFDGSKLAQPNDEVKAATLDAAVAGGVQLIAVKLPKDNMPADPQNPKSVAGADPVLTATLNRVDVHFDWYTMPDGKRSPAIQVDLTGRGRAGSYDVIFATAKKKLVGRLTVTEKK